ncbi:MAG TPA: RsmE family RNA methyltransferase, partial [Pirellulales bacterium]|nr:RsmE family RNA methyltransferase [Pirellulales bacterium]
HVLRAKPGLAVLLFNGEGGEFAAHVVRVGRAEVELAIDQRFDIDREAAIRITLGVALPKAERQRWLVEKAVELGVARLIPLLARRSVARPTAEALERMRRSVIEASKQCGRNRLMEIELGQSPADFFQGGEQSEPRWLAHPGGIPLRTAFSQAGQGTPNGIRLAVGPEGGFSDDEVAQATACGWQMVDLGERIQRIETAACTLAAVAALLVPPKAD